MGVNKRSSKFPGDIERTDEFPAPDVGGSTLPAGLGRTDTWVAPSPMAAGATPRAPAAVPAAAAAASAAAAAVSAAVAEVERLHALLVERDARIQELEVQLVLHERESARRLEESAAFRVDLQELRSRVDVQLEQIYAFEGRCEALDRVVGEAQQRGQPTAHPDGELAQQLEATRAEARRLREEAEARSERIARLTEDLGAAENLIDQLESQLRMLKDVAGATTDDSRSVNATMVSLPALKAPLPGAVPEFNGDLDDIDPFVGSELPNDGAARLLVRTDPGSGVVHVLGRRTTIGRTQDNSLQIDASYISRHHAVVFVGPDRTIIQDLGSTNGVHVNGRRIARSELADGDVVVIGKARFRFAIRPAG